MKTISINLFLGLLSLFVLLSVPLHAQQLHHIPGELLVQLKPGYTPQDLQSASIRSSGRAPGVLQHQRQVVPGLPIHLFYFDPNNFHEVHVLHQTKQHPAVQFAQFNHIVQLRSTIPDDEYFMDQWQYVNTNRIDLDADLAWEHTTGGITPLGDTIVVCIIDEGFDADHPDLVPNLWVNRSEIPNNQLDDDGNGYVDDYRGWNTYDSNDSINVFGVHGTSVAGIVGARGNNGIGVTGVNWNVKLMLVVGGTGREDEALEAYGMALSHRKLYQETDGERGAFVVATNASWGVDFLFAEDAPIWCAFYDSLGQYGILNAAATINRNVNVDLEGDMPTTCPSDFLIGVTNIDSTAKKLNGAGYGNLSIDLGAFGHQVFTIYDQGAYRRFFGTSGAAPHVAGTIALLYAADCESLNVLAKTDPAAAALLIKELILAGTIPSASLDTTTVSGGRLNILNSMQLLLNQCDGCAAPYNIMIQATDLNQVSLDWSAFSAVTSLSLFFRRSGESDFQAITNPSAPFLLENLSACATYDFFLAVRCGTVIETSDTLQFTTACETATKPFSDGPEFSFFPNPFRDYLVVNTPEPIDVRIYATSGQLVFSQQEIIGSQRLLLAHLPPGLFLIELTQNGRKYSKKIIKQN